MEPSEQRISSSAVPQSGSSLNDTSKVYLEAESYLESLGFVNNGKARFILDEHNSPVISSIAPTEFTIVNEDDSMSFVILGKSSLDMIQASSLASYMDIQQKSMSIDYDSIISSLNSTEIHQKLVELLQENSKLKETLKQNNTSMKQQFNTLATWQEEIMKIHQNHKKKFAETRELINYLNRENADLKMKLSMDRKDSTDVQYEVIDKTNFGDRSEEKAVSSKVVELQEKISSLTEELNNYKLKCDTLSSDIEKLSTISELRNSQLKQAKSTIRKQKVNIKKMGSQLSEKQTAESLLKLCGKCSERKKDIYAVTTAVQRLFLDSEETDEQTTESMKSLNEETKLLLQERERLEEEKKLINVQQEKLEVEYKNLNEAKEFLQQERISLQEEKTSLDQQSQLYEDHEKALQVEKKLLETKYDRLVSKTNALTEDVEKKSLKITQLQRAIEQHTEDINLLQTQLKYYEEDFGQEKRVKELLIKEKHKVETDLQNQVEFNKKLQDEISRLTTILTGGNRQTTTEQQEDTVLTPPVILSYLCPKCDCKFRSVESLEYHVQRCIDLD